MLLLKNLGKISARLTSKTLFTFLFCALIVMFVYVRKQIKKNRSVVRKVLSYAERSIQSAQFSSPYVPETPLPFSLCNVPLGEDRGVVLEVKTIHIRNIVAPYNPSIIRDGDGFLLFFRYDQFCDGFALPYITYIGCVRLDQNLNQTEEEFKQIELENEFNEDPRVFECNNNLYLIYSSLNHGQSRVMKMAKIDRKTLKTLHEVKLDIQQQKIEKNWNPFCIGENVEKQMFK